MNREEAKSNAAVMLAYANGKTIQVLHIAGGNHNWLDANGELVFDFSDHRYRIKLAPVLRAWRPEEAPRTFVAKSRDRVNCVATYSETRDAFLVVGPGHFSFEYDREAMFDHWNRIAEDGTEHPCGVYESPTTASKETEG